MTPKKRFGLALGGGGARGWAHIGVIQALLEAGVDVACVAGTSMGAIVGAYFAAGQLQMLREFMEKCDAARLFQFVDPVLPKAGLMDGRRLQNLMQRQLGPLKIEDLPLPFACVAVNLRDGRPVVMRRGNLAAAVRASISVPGLFTPVARAGMRLADGGLVNPLPIDVARTLGAASVIAVDLNHHLDREKRPDASGKAGRDDKRKFPPAEFPDAPPWVKRLLWTRTGTSRKKHRKTDAPQAGLFEILNASLVIMARAITTGRLHTDAPDLLIQPDLGDVHFLEFQRARETMARGYDAARLALKESPWSQDS